MANKNIWVAMILSLFVPGLGLAYDGEMKRFIIYLVLGAIFFFFWMSSGFVLDPEIDNLHSVLIWLTLLL
ncbi:MAG: hypothetical protein IKV87_06555 [Methanobrevibacter sp.]|nr:hypothetical protein [Methanobrevibacter sp.]